MPIASTVMMIRPASFGYNAETSPSNAFQSPYYSRIPSLQHHALKEWESLAEALDRSGVDLLCFSDTPLPVKPDALFPNNWISVHPDGTLVLYPMMAMNRRTECRKDILEQIQHRFHFQRIIDLRFLEKENIFLEGTGSILFDHDARWAYAALSERTHSKALKLLCKEIGYSYLTFHTLGPSGIPIYHTNVLINFCGPIVVFCKESVTDEHAVKTLEENILNSGKKFLYISYEQMMNFCGNILGVKSKSGDILCVMSERARSNFHRNQMQILEKHMNCISVPLDIIEKAGGGSARCMMAELFSTKKSI